MAKKSAMKKKSAKKAAPKAKMAAPKKMIAPPIPKVRSVSKPKNAATNSYTFSEFIENLKGFCGLAKRSQAKELAEDIALLIKDSLRKGYKIPLLGLGKLYVRQSKARIGRNPATGAEIQIPAKKRI